MRFLGSKSFRRKTTFALSPSLLCICLRGHMVLRARDEDSEIEDTSYNLDSDRILDIETNQMMFPDG